MADFGVTDNTYDLLSEFMSSYPQELTTLNPTDPASIGAKPKREWYNNPGLWAQVGQIGGALLGKGYPLGEAGKVAAGFHNSKQMNLATQKMLSNIAAGEGPMAGFEEYDTRGLTAEQTSGLTKMGLEESNRQETNRLNAITKDTDKRYKEALISDLEAKEAERKQKQTFWDDTIKGWEAGTLKKPPVVSDEMVPLLKGLGREKGEEVVSELIKASKQHPDINMVTDKPKGMVYGVDKNTGIKKWEMQITPGKDPEEVKAVVGNRTKADNLAFAEVLPKLREQYDKAHGVNAETRAKFDQVLAMINDPLRGGQAMSQLLAYGDEKTQKDWRERSNQIADSLDHGKGYPEPKPGSAAVQDIPSKQKVDIKKVKEVVAKLKKDLGRPPTPAEIQAEYEKAINTKK